MIELTTEKVTTLLRQAVTDRGEGFVYTKPPADWCLNVHTPEDDPELTEPVPGCIVGYVLHKAGVPLEAMSSARRRFFGTYELLAALADDGLITYEHPALVVLARAQMPQDEGMPWGQAVDQALRSLPAA